MPTDPALSPTLALWSLPHLSGEASPKSHIRSLPSHGTTRSANTPQGRVRTFCVHVFAVSERQRFWRCLFRFSAVVSPLVGSCHRGLGGVVGGLADLFDEVKQRAVGILRKQDLPAAGPVGVHHRLRRLCELDALVAEGLVALVDVVAQN